MANTPFFDEGLDPESLRSYRGLLDTGHDFITGLVRYGNEALEVCSRVAERTPGHVHVTLLALARHHIASMDCVNVLLSRGCVEGCPPLLRSMLESLFGVGHIVQGRHEERALAYQLARIKRRIKELRMADKSHQDGKVLEAELATDQFAAGIIDKMPAGLGARADAIEARMLSEPAFAPILAEWDRLKHPPGKPKQKDPECFSLFGGGSSVRDLAKRLNWLSLYTFVYKDLSNAVHAANALEAYQDCEAVTRLRPLRHPGGYHKFFRGVYMLFINMTDKLLGFYDPQSQQSFQYHFMHAVQPRFLRVFGDVTKSLPRWFTLEG